MLKQFSIQTDHDGAQSLWMDEDSPTVEAAAERTLPHCQKQVIKDTQPVTVGCIASMTEM
jgi:hypothetical protein